MRKIVLSLFAAFIACSAWAQDNMEAFRHFSVGAEVGLHGFGVELAMPVQKHLVIKAGYNWAPAGDLLRTDLVLDTKDLREAQEQYTAVTTQEFEHKFGDEAIINAGLGLNLTNFKAMINWYPFAFGRFYVAGGVYYTPSSKQNDPFLKVSGNTTENDWEALKELNSKYPGQEKELALTIGDEKYPVIEKDGCGYMQADFRMDPLKYYLGLGLGRCIPNKIIGMQMEAGAMIYHNSILYCQDKQVGSITDAAEGLDNDAKEILEYVDKYPIYPQITLRLSFRAL
ncbi:MAG: hypothetical protein J6T97_01455 [Bacteroidaceae bacterium]|nr:hypothetical protein [Bacteroidaceae bacterium]MBR5158558.1 hypothetical protein [Bacteroidaceae bacterium]